MENKIRIINSEGYDLAMRKFYEGEEETALISAELFEQIQFETTPDIDFVPHENFPNCCEYHRELLNEGISIYSKFPNCCDQHKRLLNADWYNKEDYKYIEKKIPFTVAYTIHLIEKHINEQNWLKLSVDYIEYTIRSFGQLPLGYGSPLGAQNYLRRIVTYLETDNRIIPKEKKDLILDFFTEEKKKAEVTLNEQPNLNVLMSIYSKWVKEFPFELSFLSHLKPHFENRNPFLMGEIEINHFNNSARAKLITEDELINWLLETTNTILTEFNTLNLYNKGLINDYNKIQLELLLEERKQELLRGYQNESKDPKTRHRKIFKKWLKDEREFIKDITPYLTKNKQEPSDQPKEESRTKEYIIREFDTIDKTKGWRYAFTNKNDYEIFINLLTNFFEYKPYEMPQKTIQLTRNCKTRLAKTISPIHKELSEKTLKSDVAFFELLRALNHFSILSNDEIYQAITR